LAGSLVLGLPLILWKVKDHVSVVEDLQFSDETVADVGTPGVVNEVVGEHLGKDSVDADVKRV